jgi:uncharacterized protein (TIGR02246 family)
MSEEQSLHQVMVDYQRCVSAGDIQGYISLFKDDVLWMPPNAQERRGKSDVFQAEAGAFSKYKFVFEMNPIEIRQLSDEWGMVLCSSQGIMTPAGGGEGTEFLYRVLFLVERQPDGRWLIARQIWNQKPAEGTAKSAGPW